MEIIPSPVTITIIDWVFSPIKLDQIKTPLVRGIEPPSGLVHWEVTSGMLVEIPALLTAGLGFDQMAVDELSEFL